MVCSFQSKIAQYESQVAHSLSAYSTDQDFWREEYFPCHITNQVCFMKAFTFHGVFGVKVFALNACHGCCMPACSVLIDDGRQCYNKLTMILSPFFSLPTVLAFSLYVFCLLFFYQSQYYKFEICGLENLIKDFFKSSVYELKFTTTKWKRKDLFYFYLS